MIHTLHIRKMPKVLQSRFGLIHLDGGFRGVLTPEFFETYPLDPKEVDLPTRTWTPATLKPWVLEVFDTKMYWKGGSLQLLHNGWVDTEKKHAVVYTPDLPPNIFSFDAHMSHTELHEMLPLRIQGKYTLHVSGQGSSMKIEGHDRVIDTVTLVDMVECPVEAVTTVYKRTGTLAILAKDPNGTRIIGDMSDVAHFVPVVKHLGLKEIRVSGNGRKQCVDGITFT